MTGKIFLKFIASVFILLITNSPSFADPVISSRTIKLVNQCPFPVWFGFAGGSVRSRISPTPMCNTDADCFSGAKCIQTGAIKQCFWINPVPQNNNFKLNPNGGNNSVSIPVFQNTLNLGWSGAVAGRTGCSGAGCVTADCGGGVGTCPPSQGFNQPATQAEFTLQTLTSDFYDVEVINGINIPVTMAPIITPLQRAALLKTGFASDPYQCGSPGAAVPTTQVGKCSWNVVLPSNDYKWVQSSTTDCVSDSNCTAPDVCGISFDPPRSPQLKKTCGKLLGYWTADQICGINPNFGAPFNCNQPLPAPQQSLTLTNLYACAPIDTCYKDGANALCCGCVNWNQIGVDVPAAPATRACINSNPTWTGNVQPKLTWLKRACPTAYTYPFDDASSTFVCQVMQDGKNKVDYTITYCPGGLTGGIGLATCLPPVNVQSSVSANKKQITLNWQPAPNSASIKFYEVHDFANRLLFRGSSPNDRSFTDATLPGTPGTFVYQLYAVCDTGTSKPTQTNVVIK